MYHFTLNKEESGQRNQPFLQCFPQDASGPQMFWKSRNRIKKICLTVPSIFTQLAVLVYIPDQDIQDVSGQIDYFNGKPFVLLHQQAIISACTQVWLAMDNKSFMLDDMSRNDVWIKFRKSDAAMGNWVKLQNKRFCCWNILSVFEAKGPRAALQTSVFPGLLSFCSHTKWYTIILVWHIHISTVLSYL